jgi:DNA-binding IclR family transcriptional regulator
MMETRENANLCALDGDEVIYLDHVHSDEHMLQSFTSLGTRVPLYATGVGKAVLSQREESEIKSYLKRTKLVAFTEKTFINKTKLIEELKKVKDDGFALDNEERETGIRCIAAPIFDHTGQCNAGISVSGPTLRITDSRIEALGETVKKYARLISDEIGYKSNG